MSTNYHNALSPGDPADAATFNTEFGTLDAQISTNVTNIATATAGLASGATGGATASAQLLKDWTEAGAYELTSATYHGTYTNTISTGVVKWPDGSAGAFTTTTFDATWEAINAYTITHVDSGQTVTQAAVTRNASGNITVKPALTVA